MYCNPDRDGVVPACGDVPRDVEKGAADAWLDLEHRRSLASHQLDDHLTLGATGFQISKRFLCLTERKNLINHRANATRVNNSAYFCELFAVRVNKKKRIADLALLRETHDLSAHQTEDKPE